MVSLIVAVDRSGGIGIEGRLPWRLSSDLKRFKALTMSHHVIAGRRTFESIGRPLPGRTTIVLTRRAGYEAPGCIIARSLEEALALSREGGDSEAFVIGGAEVYREALPLANRIYLTRVQAALECDAYFPCWDPSGWRLEEQVELAADEANEYASTFEVFVRKQPTPAACSLDRP